MKAAHASVGGAPCRKSGTMGRKWIFQMLSLNIQRLSLLTANVGVSLTGSRKYTLALDQAE
jgi:hypothetical protein